METRFELPEELFKLGVYASDDLDEIDAERTVLEKNKKLLEKLERADVEKLVDFRKL